jgi:hypothetical protein
MSFGLGDRRAALSVEFIGSRQIVRMADVKIRHGVQRSPLRTRFRRPELEDQRTLEERSLFRRRTVWTTRKTARATPVRACQRMRVG